MDIRAGMDIQEDRKIRLTAGIPSPILCFFNPYTSHIVKLQTAYEWQINIYVEYNSRGQF